MVFPTQVGVILNAGRKIPYSVSIPHASGGDPEPTYAKSGLTGYSPRKWG